MVNGLCFVFMMMYLFGCRSYLWCFINEKLKISCILQKKIIFTISAKVSMKDLHSISSWTFTPTYPMDLMSNISFIPSKILSRPPWPISRNQESSCLLQLTGRLLATIRIRSLLLPLTPQLLAFGDHMISRVQHRRISPSSLQPSPLRNTGVEIKGFPRKDHLQY